MLVIPRETLIKFLTIMITSDEWSSSVYILNFLGTFLGNHNIITVELSCGHHVGDSLLKCPQSTPVAIPAQRNRLLFSCILPKSEFWILCLNYCCFNAEIVTHVQTKHLTLPPFTKRFKCLFQGPKFPSCKWLSKVTLFYDTRLVVLRNSTLTEEWTGDKEHMQAITMVSSQALGENCSNNIMKAKKNPQKKC